METINIAHELRSGRHYGVFIDDTGSPGLNTPGLNAQRKSWVAVLVAPSQIAEVMDEMPKALSFLSELGLNNPEFHFTDILAGQGEFKKLDLQQRLALFEFMAHIFSVYRFDVLVQTLAQDNASDIHSRAHWPQHFGPLKFKNHEDLALIFALLRVRMHLRSISGGTSTACVVVDEGRLKNGTAIVIPSLAPEFHAGAILFANSRHVLPLQLADFAAFVMNRSQLVRVREQLSDIDKKFMEIVSPIAERFINIDAVRLQGWPDLANVQQGLN